MAITVLGKGNKKGWHALSLELEDFFWDASMSKRFSKLYCTLLHLILIEVTVVCQYIT